MPGESARLEVVGGNPLSPPSPGPCRHCGGPLPPPRPQASRPRLYCGGRCRYLARIERKVTAQARRRMLEHLRDHHRDHLAAIEAELARLNGA